MDAGVWAARGGRSPGAGRERTHDRTVLQSLIDRWPSGAAVAEDGDKSAQKARLAQAMAVVSFTKTIDQAREREGEGAGGRE